MNSTEEASAVMEGLRMRKLGWRQPHQQADALPPEAHGLAKVLRRSDIIDSAAAYETASQDATAAQDLHKTYARRAAVSGFLAAVVAALMLLVGVHAGKGPVAHWLGLIHGLLVVIVWHAVFHLSVRKPYRDWVLKRSAAERQRIMHFRSVLSAHVDAGPNAPATMRLLLEYVRVFLIEDQKAWFAAKADVFGGHVRRSTYWRWLSALLISAAALPAVVAFIPDRMMIELPLVLNAIAEWASKPTHSAVLAFVGVVGGALQGLIASLGAISLIDRNATSYRSMVEVLDVLSNQPLKTAREAAARGDVTGLDAFWNELSFQLLSEQREWSAVLGNVQLLALGHLSRLAKPV